MSNETVLNEHDHTDGDHHHRQDQAFEDLEGWC